MTPQASLRLPAPLLGLAGALALLLPGTALAKPPIWIVRDADSTILLFGSVHMLPKGVDWTPPALTDALANADDLWFEVPMNEVSSAEIASQAARRSMLPPGQTLSSLLDRTSRARLKRLAAKLKLPMESLELLQPWMAEVQLSVTFLEKRGGLATEGVEEKISAMAGPKVKRRAFETSLQQVQILSGDDMDAQVASLKETLRELDRDPGSFDRMLKAWMTGDARGLDKEAVEPMRTKTPQSYKSLVLDRNKAWTEVIARRLAGSGRTVMVVGAGHLVGPDSVPAMLRARGIPVQGP